MTTTVRMIVDMQGGRYDGQIWPGYKGLIEVPDWEAEHMITGGVAEPVDAPDLERGYDVLKQADLDFEMKLKLANPNYKERLKLEDLPTAAEIHEQDMQDPEYREAYESYEEDDFDREEDEPVIKKPYGNANKPAWIEYALSQGADPAKVKGMTKDRIIEVYGD